MLLDLRSNNIGQYGCYLLLNLRRDRNDCLRLYLRDNPGCFQAERQMKAEKEGHLPELAASPAEITTRCAEEPDAKTEEFAKVDSAKLVREAKLYSIIHTLTSEDQLKGCNFS